jgi:hypothetical protein
LHVKGMLKLFMGKNHTTIVHVLNRAMTWILDELTPFEKWIGDRLDVLHFGVFGYFMYKHILKELSKNLNKKMFFFQYASNNKCYCLWAPHTHKITMYLM